MVMSVTRLIRDSRRADAKLRQDAYNKLTTQQKLDSLPKLGAKKQRAKLEAQLLVEQGKPSEVIIADDEQPKKASKKKVKG